MSVQQGLDPQQITTIANQLASESDRLEHVHHSGTAMLATLTDAWAGDDLGRFHDAWQHNAPQIHAMATALRVAAKELHQQAQDQTRTSAAAAGGGVEGRAPGSGPHATNPWDQGIDFGKGLLLPSKGVVDTAKKIADRTGDGIRDGVDRAREGVDNGIDRVREGMDWLEERADQARDWTAEQAERLADISLRVADTFLLTGASGLVARAALKYAERKGWVDDGRGEAGEIVELRSKGDAQDSKGNPHSAVRQPTSLDEIMRSTSDAYENDGNVRITEITRPDGSTAYIVNTPGTQTWDFGSTDNPLDSLGNLATVNGDSAAATEAVWDAMEDAGIPPGSPVLMAGHSQGGMINQTLMSDPRFTERFNVTHAMTYGSPVDSIPDTSGARQLHVAHAGDVVPRSDYDNFPRPSRLRGDDNVVQLDNPPGYGDPTPPGGLGQPIGPARPLEGDNVKFAHDHQKYAASVAASDDPRVDAFEDDLGDFIVPTGDSSKVSAVDVEIRRRK